jgi:glycyl-tRNA synthetase alpha subunit
MVYQTDGTAGFYYYNGSSWLVMASGIGSQWTTTGSDIYYSSGKVGIGTSSPSTALHIYGTNPLTLTGVQVGSTSDSILTISSGTVKKLPASSGITGWWNLAGNASTNSGQNFIGTTDNISLCFRTNNTERIKIDSTGKVGIGTTSPATALHVYGTNPLTLTGVQDGAITDSLLTIYSGTVKKIPTSAGLVWFWGVSGNSGTNSGQNFIGTTDNISLKFRTNNTERMKIDSVGKVGIGTSSPATALHVYGTNPLTLEGVQVGSTSDSLLTISSGTVKKLPASNGTTGFWNLRGNASTNSGQNYIGTSDNISLRFRTNNTERMKIDSVGNIGIGTTSPATVLHVVGTNPLTLNGVQVGSTSDSLLTISSGTVKKLPASNGTTGFWNLNGNASTNSGQNYIGTSDNISLRFRTNNTERMKIDSVGNIGIGTTSPSTALHVVGTNPLTLNGVQVGTSSDSLLTISSGTVKKLPAASGTTGFWNLNGNASTNSGQNYIGTSDNISFRIRTNNTERVKIDSVGKIGIGTSSPANALHISATDPLRLDGVQTGTGTDSLLTISSGVVKKIYHSTLLISSQTLTSGTTYTPTSSSVKTIMVYMLGGGGGGGGVSAQNARCAAGSGGGSGSVCQFIITNVSGTYAYTIGAGGTAGASGSNGGNGGNTTFTKGSTVYTAYGGGGGYAMSAAISTSIQAGGAGGALSTNGDVNGGGGQGVAGIRLDGANGLSGSGANSPYGGGGAGIGTDVNANNATGYGAGGGGALSLSVTSPCTGGTGAPGIIIIYEFQ